VGIAAIALVRLMFVFVMLVIVMVMMVMFTGGFGFAGTAGKLVHELDELVRRGVVFAGHVAGRDRDGSVLKNRQLHFSLHGQTPFQSRNLFWVFAVFCQPS
jgi:predicted tellurium resistance membrane protein TerC